MIPLKDGLTAAERTADLREPFRRLLLSQLHVRGFFRPSCPIAGAEILRNDHMAIDILTINPSVHVDGWTVYIGGRWVGDAGIWRSTHIITATELEDGDVGMILVALSKRIADKVAFEGYQYGLQ